jgi:hypothetical protein
LRGSSSFTSSSVKPTTLSGPSHDGYADTLHAGGMRMDHALTAEDLKMDPLAWQLSFGLVIVVTLLKDLQVT